MTHPPCFDTAADYEAWLKASQDCSLDSTHKPTYCTDCLPEYQHKMILQGRCTHPTVRFFKNGPRSYYGRRQQNAPQKED